MGPLVALLLSAADLASGQAAGPRPLWAFSPGLGVGQELLGIATLRGDLELSIRPSRFIRFELIAGGGWAPAVPPFYPGQHGVFRVLAGLDVLVPQTWGTLFFGLAGGFEHTNLMYQEYFGPDEHPELNTVVVGWFSGPSLLARAGIEVRVAENVAVGGSLAGSLWVLLPLVINTATNPHATLEVGARISFLF